MALTDLTAPAVGDINLSVTFKGVTVTFQRFLSYEYTEDYLSPSDEGSFDLDRSELSALDLQVLVPGATVDVSVNGLVQSHGIIDEPASNGNRDSGSLIRVVTRDWLSPAVDGQIDPQTRFVPSMTLLDVVNAALGPYGVTAVAEDNVANRNAITGRIYGTPTSKKGKPLASYVLNELKPYPNEGAFAFCTRVSTRFGLWVWPAVDGKTVIVGTPDFDQAPRYGLQLATDTKSPSNNVLDWHFAKSRRDQPSVIMASGFGGGGVFAKSKLRAGIVNPVVNADNSKIIDAYPSVPFVSVPAVTAAFAPFVEGNPRPIFLYDSESHTQAQLNAFLQRELSLRMRKALTARYTFAGHLINGQPPAVDSIVNVNDQVNDWQGPLWVMGRRFSKSRDGGTKTALELLLPGTLLF